MNCTECKDFLCKHRSQSTAGGECFYESKEQMEKLLAITTEATLDYIDWSSFRREAAKDILTAFASNSVVIDERPDSFDPDFYSRIAVEWADSLIKHLKDDQTANR